MTEGEIAPLSDQAMKELRWAYKQLEHPSLASRLSNQLAEPLEELIELLPQTWQVRIDKTLKANTYRTVRLGWRKRTAVADN